MLIDSTLANDKIEKKKLVSIASDIVRCLMVSVGVRMLTNQRPGIFSLTNKKPEGSESGWIYQEGSSIKHDTPEWHRLTNQRPGARLSDQSEGPTPRTFLAPWGILNLFMVTSSARDAQRGLLAVNTETLEWWHVDLSQGWTKNLVWL